MMKMGKSIRHYGLSSICKPYLTFIIFIIAGLLLIKFYIQDVWLMCILFSKKISIKKKKEK